MLLTVKELRFGYNSELIFDDFEIEFRGPGLYIILGPNGVGKSTLLKIIAGLLKPLKGSLEFNGKPLKRGEAIYVPQDNELLPWLNVVDNVALPLIVAGHSKARAREIALRTLREVGLERLAWRYPKTLSGGERKKVAVTRVLISGSPVLLLDEPTANIDPTARKDFWNLLKKVATEKLVIASSHDVFEALKEANEAFVLSGRPAKVVAKLRGGIESCEVFSELTKLYYGS